MGELGSDEWETVDFNWTLFCYLNTPEFRILFTLLCFHTDFTNQNRRTKDLLTHLLFLSETTPFFL